MPWLIGIDEAGYGPNLGSMVQTAVGVRAPSECNLWEALAIAVRKHGGPDDGRLIIDDSKKVYGASHSLRKLELGVLAALGLEGALTAGALLAKIAPASLPELRGETWFVEHDPLPVAVDAGKLGEIQSLFQSACQAAEVVEFWAHARVTPAPLFNSLLDELDNKANVLAHGLCWLLRESNHPNGDSEPVIFAIDRLGGRRYHAALIENACPEGWLETIEENERTCRYRMNGRRERRWSFEVQAESRHLTVALASMVSKYLREILMRQFNRFWQTHVPGLTATAGYPVDAARFLQDIRPAMQKLGIEDRLVWRRK